MVYNPFISLENESSNAISFEVECTLSYTFHFEVGFKKVSCTLDLVLLAYEVQEITKLIIFVNCDRMEIQHVHPRGEFLI